MHMCMSVCLCHILMNKRPYVYVCMPLSYKRSFIGHLPQQTLEVVEAVVEHSPLPWIFLFSDSVLAMMMFDSFSKCSNDRLFSFNWLTNRSLFMVKFIKCIFFFWFLSSILFSLGSGLRGSLSPKTSYSNRFSKSPSGLSPSSRLRWSLYDLKSGILDLKSGLKDPRCAFLFGQQPWRTKVL